MTAPTHALLPLVLLSLTASACASSTSSKSGPTASRSALADDDERPSKQEAERPSTTDKTERAATMTSSPPPVAPNAGGEPTMAVDDNTVGSGTPGGEGEPVEEASGEQIAFDAVHFRTDSSTLDDGAIATLDALASHLEAHERVQVTVEGHCDERGTEAYNLALGHARAEAIKRYLVGLGVDEVRVSTVSYGEERPAVRGTSRQSLAQNRRGELVLFGAGEATAMADSD